MSRLNVNPTRMVLTGLKRQLRTARRGHKLMKDKRDELMRRFLELARENKRLRGEVEEALMQVYGSLDMAAALMSSQALEEALMVPKQSVILHTETENVMSVHVPRFQFELEEGAGGILPYGYATTSGELDLAVEGMSRLLPLLLELSAMEKAAALLADEIEKTRRRVNALEHVRIPRYEETIRYITMKLDENERGNQIRLMKVKDMMLAQAIEERRGAEG